MTAVLTGRNSDAGKLARAVAVSDKRLDPFRRRRVEFLRHFAGPYFGELNKGDIGRQPLNLVYSILSTLEPTLSMRQVKTSASTRNASIRWFAERMRLTLDYVADKIGVAYTVRDAIRDSLSSMGIVKTGYDKSAGGLPFCESVSMDDYVIDHRARVRRPGSYAYEGHRFRMSFEEAMDGGQFDQEARGQIERMNKNQVSRSGRADTISGPPQMGEEEWDPQIELVELYMPGRKGIVWLPGTLESTVNPLREFGWYGHEEGPLDILGYSWVSDNLVPLPIIAVIFDLYLLENVLANKIGDQALAQKDFVLAPIAAGDKDAQTIREVRDGQVAMVSDPKAAQQISLGGANEKGYAAVGWFHDFLTRVSGNTDIIGGLKAQSKTLGQDQILLSNASIRINDMRGYVYDLARKIVQKLAWYVWNDPGLKLDLIQRVDGGAEIPTRWEPDRRQGKLSDYDFNIQVYSRSSDTPEDKYARIVDLVQKVIAPLAPVMAQQGKMPDAALITKIAGDGLDIPELDEVWQDGTPVAQAPSAPTTGQGTTETAPGGTMRPGTPPSPVEDMAMAAVGVGA